MAGFCIAAAIICKITDKTGKEYTVMIVTISAVLITSVAISVLSPVIEFIMKCFEKTGVSDEYMNILFKSTGVCYISSLSSGVCRDSGENSLAAAVDTIGKITLAVISLPVFEKLFETVTSLVG